MGKQLTDPQASHTSDVGSINRIPKEIQEAYPEFFRDSTGSATKLLLFKHKQGPKKDGEPANYEYLGSLDPDATTPEAEADEPDGGRTLPAWVWIAGICFLPTSVIGITLMVSILARIQDFCS